MISFKIASRLVLSAAMLALSAGTAFAQPQYRETVTAYGADGLPETVTITNPGGTNPVTTFDWDTSGNLISVTDAEGGTAAATYDDNRRVLTMSSNAASASLRGYSQFTYDVSGRLLTTEVSEDGTATGVMRATTVTYTDAGQAATITDPAGDASVFTYNNAGQLDTSADPAGRTQAFLYNEDGMMRSSYEAYGTDEEVRSHITWFNTLGERNNLRQAKGIGSPENVLHGASWNPDFSTYWNFDPFGRVDEVKYPGPESGDARQVDRFTLSPLGNVLTHTTRSNDVITNTFDVPNRITTHTVPAATGTQPSWTTTTNFNLTGETESVISPDQHDAGDWELHYEYDYAGRILSETQISPDPAPATTFRTRTVSYQYDLNGNRTRITWPDGYFVQYQYNDAGQLTHIKSNGTDLLAWYDYDNMGQLDAYVVSTVLGQAVGRIFPTYQVDGDLEQLDYRFTNDTNVVFDYGYDASGLVTSQDVNQASWEWSPATSNVTLVSDTYTANNLDQYSEV